MKQFNMIPKCLMFVLMIGLSCAQTQESTESSTQTDVMPSELPGGITLPAVPKEHKEIVADIKDKLMTATQKRCEKYGNSESFTKFNGVGHEFGECVGKLVNSEVLQNEIALGKKNGSVDDVFKKYCDKTPQFEECAMKAADTVKACLSPEEQEQLKTVKVVAEELAKFVCFKDGDRLALFISDNGPECFQANQEQLKDCANQTLGVQNNVGTDILENNFISFDEEHCKKIFAFQACSVKALEKCERPTTANIVESLFKYAKKFTPCKNYTVAVEPSAAPGLTVAITALTTTSLVIFLM